MTHHSADAVIAALDTQPDGPMQTARLDLASGDSAWNPASTKHVVCGPGHLIYHRYTDGGIDAVLTDDGAR